MNVEIQENKYMESERKQHQCPNCTNMCYGKQCSECHIKMMEKIQGNCLGCSKAFYAVRQDGTKRKRCKECQDSYNEKHISICPDCKNTYHAVLDDGRKFDKCYKCYQDNMNKCAKCDKNAYGQKFCRDCYQSEKLNRVEREVKKCKNETCFNNTTYTYCKSCNDSLRNVENNYMMSTCEECGYRGVGNFKLCNYCR
jgi:hypothetical protein